MISYLNDFTDRKSDPEDFESLKQPENFVLLKVFDEFP